MAQVWVKKVIMDGTGMDEESQSNNVLFSYLDSLNPLCCSFKLCYVTFEGVFFFFISSTSIQLVPSSCQPVRYVSSSICYVLVRIAMQLAIYSFSASESLERAGIYEVRIGILPLSYCTTSISQLLHTEENRKNDL